MGIQKYMSFVKAVEYGSFSKAGGKRTRYQYPSKADSKTDSLSRCHQGAGCSGLPPDLPCAERQAVRIRSRETFS